MPMLEVRSLSAGYDAPILTDVSCCASGGEVVGILGRNGCGKTTLLRGIAGSVRRFGGQILVNGRDCTAMKPREQAKHIAVLPQQTDVLEGITARDLILMGRYPHAGPFGAHTPDDIRFAEDSAATLGIAHLLDRDCAHLSQGQRQLVLLARCLAQDAPVLLLDEPNTALDYDNTHTLFAALRRLAKARGKAVLMVLHDPELALRYCTRVLILHGSRLAEDLPTAGATPEVAEKALRRLYPHIILRRDAHDGSLRCYENTTGSEDERLC